MLAQAAAGPCVRAYVRGAGRLVRRFKTTFTAVLRGLNQKMLQVFGSKNRGNIVNFCKHLI